jgi:hypothetical protein
MPKIMKQSTVKRKSPAGLNIMAVSEMPVEGMKVCLYGRGKTGKTSLACTFPKPLLIIGTEDGTKSIRTIKDCYFHRLKNSSQVEQLVEAVKEDYKTVVLDTAGGLQDMILKEILGLDDVPIEKSWGIAGREQWQICGAQTKERLRSLLDLADGSTGTNVVVIAHERNFNDEGSGSELLMPTVGAALTPSVTGWLNGACDYICQTFIREQIVKKTMKVGSNKDTQLIQRTGKAEYCLRVGPHPIYMTGFRRVRSNEAMPEVILDPSYEKIIQVIEG